MRFAVKEKPIETLEIRFAPPVPVSGRVLGLELGEIVHWVTAEGEHPDRRRLGMADQEGGFVIPDLTPGVWTIKAGRGYRTASTAVRIAPGDRAAAVDLVFRDEEEAPGEPAMIESE